MRRWFQAFVDWWVKAEVGVVRDRKGKLVAVCSPFGFCAIVVVHDE